MSRIPVALIGAGRLGARHARTLASQVPEADLRVVADARADVAATLAATLPSSAWTGDPSLRIADATIRAVIIVTPTDTHAALIEAAAAAGKDIFCEKPVSLTWPRLTGHWRQSARPECGCRSVSNDDTMLITCASATWCMRETLGQPALLRATLRDVVPPTADYLATSGGIFVDMGVHDFDAARFVLSSEVVEVFAMGAVATGEPFASARRPGYGDGGTALCQWRAWANRPQPPGSLWLRRSARSSGHNSHRSHRRAAGLAGEPTDRIPVGATTSSPTFPNDLLRHTLTNWRHLLLEYRRGQRLNAPAMMVERRSPSPWPQHGRGRRADRSPRSLIRSKSWPLWRRRRLTPMAHDRCTERTCAAMAAADDYCDQWHQPDKAIGQRPRQITMRAGGQARGGRADGGAAAAPGRGGGRRPRRNPAAGAALTCSNV